MEDKLGSPDKRLGREAVELKDLSQILLPDMESAAGFAIWAKGGEEAEFDDMIVVSSTV